MIRGIVKEHVVQASGCGGSPLVRKGVSTVPRVNDNTIGDQEIGHCPIINEHSTAAIAVKYGMDDLKCA